jgi:molybdenum cofactor cytidylyltransferase
MKPGGIEALLLAAGESTRMGRPKQLLDWGGFTLLEWQVRQLRDAGASSVVVVVGYMAEDIATVAEASGARVVTNLDYRQGRASSLRAGATALDPRAERVVILSVDQPRPAWVTRRLITAEARAALIVAPRHAGRGGHPVILDGSIMPELARVSEESLGLKAVMDRHKTQTVYVDFENPCVIVDLNTPAEYEKALASFQRDEWSEDFRSP